MTIGEKIRAVRIEKGFSQRRLQEESGVERNFLSLVENNHRSPSFKTLMRIANALNVSVGYITDYNNSPQEQNSVNDSFLNKLKKVIDDDELLVSDIPIPIIKEESLVKAMEHQEIEDFFPIPSKFISATDAGKYRCLWIKDDERAFPPLIEAGALICLDSSFRNPRELENEIVVFFDEKGCVIRRLTNHGGVILGMPEKPFVQKPLVIPAYDKNSILGKVVWCWNKFTN